jgi:hypothetical protein
LVVLADDADYWPRGNEFNGTIEWVQLHACADDQDHLIGPEERFNTAMANQELATPLRRPHRTGD